MKNQLNNFKTAALGVVLVLTAFGATAQNRQTYRVAEVSAMDVPAKAERLEDLDEMSFTEMINSVKLDSKSAELIRKFQEKEGRNRLFSREYNEKNRCTVETYRNKEVLLVTIPAASLFAPNDTVLTRQADALLSPLKRYLKDPDMYRVLMVMHTDNTGSEEYRDNLTEARSQAVADWFDDHGADTTYLFPYAFGDDMPLVENNSMANRERNRRLEVYLVPGKKMLEQARKGRIVF